MAIMITSMNPQYLLTGQSKEIFVAGYGFIGQVAVMINAIYVPVFFNSPNLVKFVLPYIVAGVYAITVLNGDGSQFVFRPGITISDPPPGVVMGTLGSAGLPIVLPARIVESSCNATVNSSANNSLYKSPALIYSNPTT